MASSFSIAASFAGAASLLLSSSGVHAQVAAAQRALPAKAQIIDQKSFNVLEVVPPPLEFNASSEFLWPGVTHESLTEKPFHIYDPEFYDIIGSDPSLTLIATSETDPIFHEAVVWYPPTEEVFFVQNAGPPAAGTGLNKSSIVQKIRLADAEALRNGSLGTKEVTVTTVPSNPQVINPNGGTNYKGQIIFAGEGQGDRVTSSLYLMNPVEPYNTTVLVNNYFGRQFNSLNDVVVSRRNGDIYFTDTQYGYWQNFRPAPGLPNQVYRLNPTTGALTVVTDEFVSPNGITLSPDGTYAYVTDTGISQGQFGTNFTKPATVYAHIFSRFPSLSSSAPHLLSSRTLTTPSLPKQSTPSNTHHSYRFEVKEDGTFENRKIFAHTSARLPDGVHCDSKGNVYAGCNDGVHVWNPSGKLIGKIYTGTTAANFQFAGDGRMVITGQTKLFYATFAASGVALT
ncbi:D-lactonohydrolase [Colletotrichum lupini]|uniref:D-lactonohydrolase n=1 Tax=Colletotrichum lupini TaxID=145971 RepID=A0A9Q8T0S7_9PEZI|nr:D-lactonohydrolase [Colletotrichum lupini]UQC87149.1 D-lactonohydrolase [Colletotrichum lupini]